MFVYHYRYLEHIIINYYFFFLPLLLLCLFPSLSLTRLLFMTINMTIISAMTIRNDNHNLIEISLNFQVSLEVIFSDRHEIATTAGDERTNRMESVTRERKYKGEDRRCDRAKIKQEHPRERARRPFKSRLISRSTRIK